MIERFVTNVSDPVYCVYGLPEEVVSVLFAYVSRSKNSFRKNLELLIKDDFLKLKDVSGQSYDFAQEKARKFHEKWVIGYGHSSVAEHSVIHYCIEDISILATKFLEDSRLGSYTEKSTRYQFFDETSFYVDPVIEQSDLKDDYISHNRFLFEQYRIFFDKIHSFLKKKYPIKPGIKEKSYESAVHSATCDITRYLLPLSTKTMVAVTWNARVAAHSITKMLSSSLAELRNLGKRLYDEGKKIVPTLLKHVKENSYISDTRESVFKIAKQFDERADFNDFIGENYVKLIDYTKDAEDVLAASILFEGSSLPYHVIFEKMKALDSNFKKKIIKEYFARMGKHDYPLRNSEYIQYMFEILVDYGAYRDIQRHRIGTMSAKILTPDYGYEIPDEIVEAGLEKKYKEIMERSAEIFYRIEKSFKEQAQYVLPMAFRKQILVGWNLREVFHFVKLRSAPQGHISYRKIAWQMYDRVVEVHPFLKDFLVVDKKVYPFSRLKNYG